MVEYYSENFESYSQIFSDHALQITGLMKTLNDQIYSRGLSPVESSKDLFSMVVDLKYYVDQTYKQKYNLEEPDFKLTTYMSKDELLSEMRNLFTQELTRYMGHLRDAEQ